MYQLNKDNSDSDTGPLIQLVQCMIFSNFLDNVQFFLVLRKFSQGFYEGMVQNVFRQGLIEKARLGIV